MISTLSGQNSHIGLNTSQDRFSVCTIPKIMILGIVVEIDQDLLTVPFHIIMMYFIFF